MQRAEEIIYYGHILTGSDWPRVILIVVKVIFITN